MATVMLDDPGSNPGVNHGYMCLSRRTNVFCLVLTNYEVYRQLGKKPVDVSVYLFIQPTSILYMVSIFEPMRKTGSTQKTNLLLQKL
jgi:hypothetical protein